MSETKLIGAKVPEAEWRHVSKVAKDMDLTIAQIVRRAVKEWLERNQPAPEKERG